MLFLFQVEFSGKMGFAWRIQLMIVTVALVHLYIKFDLSFFFSVCLV